MSSKVVVLCFLVVAFSSWTAVACDQEKDVDRDLKGEWQVIGYWAYGFKDDLEKLAKEKAGEKIDIKNVSDNRTLSAKPVGQIVTISETNITFGSEGTVPYSIVKPGGKNTFTFVNGGDEWSAIFSIDNEHLLILAHNEKTPPTDFDLISTRNQHGFLMLLNRGGDSNK